MPYRRAACSYTITAQWRPSKAFGWRSDRDICSSGHWLDPPQRSAEPISARDAYIFAVRGRVGRSGSKMCSFGVGEPELGIAQSLPLVITFPSLENDC
jgi:hypothetical protein